MTWDVYLSGEIHTDWRQQLAAGIATADLPVTLVGPITDHAASDACGVRILGDETEPFCSRQASLKRKNHTAIHNQST